MASLELRQINKRYTKAIRQEDDNWALHDINLQSGNNEFIAIVGPSGCGKTTLLRIIAGLEPATSGSVLLDGKSIDSLAPRQRDVAMVFQGESLYPHLSVFENIAFPLKMRGQHSSDEIKAMVESTAKQLSVEELLERMPNSLSGGQRQRIAIGRALVRKPSVFLMDEPFSHLDAHLRRHLRTEIDSTARGLASDNIVRDPRPSRSDGAWSTYRGHERRCRASVRRTRPHPRITSKRIRRGIHVRRTNELNWIRIQSALAPLALRLEQSPCRHREYRVKLHQDR